MTRITLAGRTDIDEYFKLSGVFERERLTHTPLLVFIADQDSVTVRIVDTRYPYRFALFSRRDAGNGPMGWPMAQRLLPIYCGAVSPTP